MADRALILSADHYSIPDKDTGEVQNLFQVWYCTDYRSSSSKELGLKPTKVLTTPEIFELLRKQELPAIFDLDLRSRPGKGNAAALMIVGYEYVSTPVLFPSVVSKTKAA